MHSGKVYLVGAGPGEPGLLTLRGRDVLRRAQAVVYDALISARSLDHAPPSAERIYVGKRAGEHSMPQNAINRLLVDLARRGLLVVRLKGGDPFFFGRGGEEALALTEAGVAWEVVPGVTAGVAAAACAGIPVTHRGLAGCAGFVTGHAADGDDGAPPDWASLAVWKGTLAFYMGVSNLPIICRELASHGLSPKTPAAVIEHGASPRQRVVSADVASLPAAAEAAKIAPPAMIVIGRVVALREKLDWFSRRALAGKKIVVTRPREQSREMVALLEDAGAEVVECPAIRIEPALDQSPLRRAAREAKSHDWIVFTSANAADAFWHALRAEGLDARSLGAARVAAIGPATARRLERVGIVADCRPDRFTTADLAKALAGGGGLAGRRILCPRADIAPPDLSASLSAGGAAVTEVVAYRTVPEDCGAAGVRAMLAAGEIRWLTFTSSSTVECFLRSIPPQAVAAGGARVASIGPATSRALRRAGLAADVEADSATAGGLVAAIIHAEAGRRDR
jgi:uroporphyrinogen III methyltransferase / synthase